LVVGALVIGALVIGALVIGALVVGALVVGALVVGALVVGALVVGALVQGLLTPRAEARGNKICLKTIANTILATTLRSWFAKITDAKLYLSILRNLIY